MLELGEHLLSLSKNIYISSRTSMSRGILVDDNRRMHIVDVNLKIQFFYPCLIYQYLKLNIQQKSDKINKYFKL